MTLLLVRLLISAAMFSAPFALMAFASKSQHGAMWILFPLFAVVPGVVGALVLFVPIEAILESRGLHSYKNAFVPLAGALIAPILLVVTTAASGKIGLVVERYSSAGVNAWGPIVLWMVLGAVFGALWRLTAWLAGLMGFANG